MILLTTHNHLLSSFFYWLSLAAEWSPGWVYNIQNRDPLLILPFSNPTQLPLKLEEKVLDTSSRGEIQLNVMLFPRMPLLLPVLPAVSPGHFTSPPALQPGGGNAQLDILQMGTYTYTVQHQLKFAPNIRYLAPAGGRECRIGHLADR